MQTSKKWFERLLVAGLVFLFFLLLFQQKLQIPGWLRVAGRIHPLFVHFPIVLVLLVLLLYWLPQGKGVIPDAWSADILRLITALSAVFAAIMGLLLSFEGGREGSMLALHKWGGVLIAMLAAAYYHYYSRLSSKPVMGKSFTVLAAICILFTGHWGGDLTHGENYVLGPVMQTSPERVAPEKALVFAHIIRPILETKCLQCHNSGSSKGGLVMDKMAGMLAGGKSGPLFVAGKPDLSLLIQRIHLPVEEKKHMPPASKPQLTTEESVLLSSWIQAGAPMEKRLFSLPATDSFRLLAQQWLSAGSEEEEEPVFEFPAADEKTIAGLNNNYRVIEQQGKKSPALAVNFYGRSAYSAKALEELLPLKRQITELSLARMPVKDNDLSPVGKMENLRRLNLNYTDISAKGLSVLAACKQLQTVSLSGTAVTEAGLEPLLSLPQLNEVYIWNAPIDTNAIARLRKKFNHVRIDNGFVDDGHFIVALTPPQISVPDSVFNPAVAITLSHPYKGVQIKYTLDGSFPDSSHGYVYSGPLLLDSSASLVARTFKKNWEGSRPVNATYIKSIRPDSAALTTEPDSAFRKLGASILYNGRLGGADLNSDDGQWLGYKNKPAGFYLFYKKEQQLHQLSVYVLRQVDFDNYPPSRIEVWGGSDTKNMKILSRLVLPVVKKEDPSVILPVKMNFPSSAVRCLKLLAYPISGQPPFSKDKKKPVRMFISEVTLQ